ncbi:hypothetical protein, partial [Clostridium nitritogenes]|uniref:hypothetical protein n=1 Tax=Clostridium nitritogenes TaxID=83340 RepID=UPI0031F89316
DQTLNKKFNLLTHKTYFNKRIAGLNVFYIFCSIFKDLSNLVDCFIIITFELLIVNNFFQSF